MDESRGQRQIGGASHFNNPHWLMPRDAYVSEAWFRREQEQLFSRSWNFLTLTRFGQPGSD